MHGQSDTVLHSSYVVLSGIDSVVIQGSGPIGRQHEEGYKKTTICDVELGKERNAPVVLIPSLARTCDTITMDTSLALDAGARSTTGPDFHRPLTPYFEVTRQKAA